MGEWLELLQVEYKKNKSAVRYEWRFCLFIVLLFNVEITQHYHYNQSLNVVIIIKVVRANVKICF